MAIPRGARLEELARAYFARQGFVAIRSVSIQFEGEEVTDADVWLFGRQGGGVRTRTIVDVKDKKSPKAFERIMWARGMQLALGCDRAVVATTEANSKVTRFAQSQNIALITSKFLHQWATEDVLRDRLSLEELIAHIQANTAQKQDGDWVKQIASAKSAVVSLPSFPAFNKAIGCFHFFAERATTRPQHREQAVRGAYLCAALACIALDAALEKLSFEEPKDRFNLLYSGVTYGDAGDGRVKSSIDKVLSVIAQSMENGRVIARQTRDALDGMFAEVRAEIIAEFFAKDQNSGILFIVARELEARAHMRTRTELTSLGLEAKSILGVFADFVGVKRTSLMSTEFVTGPQIVREVSNKSTSENDPIVAPKQKPLLIEPSSDLSATERKSARDEEDPKLL